MTKESSFADRLRAARSSAGLSQSDLERKSGIPKTTLSRYENGHVEPSLSTLSRLAAALGVAEGDLLPGVSSMEERLYFELRKRGVDITSVGECERIAQIVADEMSIDERRGEA